MSDWSGLTGSGVGDACACPTREALPKCNATGTYAMRGNALHDFAKKVGKNPECRAQALLDIEDEDWRATAARMDLSSALVGLNPKGFEVAFSINVKDYTCRLIGYDIERKYEEYLALTNQPPLTLWEIPFTVDLWAETDDGIPVELDWKSGQSIGDPAEHMQRRLSAAGLMFYMNTDEAISRVGYIREDGSIIPDGCPFFYADAIATCDEAVKGIQAVLAARALLASGVMPPVNPDRDRQCHYCDSFDYCPYWNNLIKGAGDGLREITKGPDLNAVSAEKRGQIFDYVKDVLKVATELEKKLKEHTYRGPQPVDEKWEFRAENRSGKTYFDGAAARGLIVTLLGQLGKDEKEIEKKLAELNKKGSDYLEVKKRKRELPVIKKAS